MALTLFAMRTSIKGWMLPAASRKGEDRVDLIGVTATRQADARYIETWPPSTKRHVPVTYDASSQARKRMHAATSAGVPGRLSIVPWPNVRLNSSEVFPADVARRS